MNGNFFQNPTFPNNSTPINMDMEPNNMMQNNAPILNAMPTDTNNIDNIFRINKGKRVIIYASYNNSKEQDKTFSGIIENYFKDYLIISNPTNSNWYLIKLNDINYIEFMEKINI